MVGLLVSVVACGRSHHDDDLRPDAGPQGDGSMLVDAPSLDAASVPGDPMCGIIGPTEECRELCNDVCASFSECGGDQTACLVACRRDYACPGETPDHDRGICRGASPDRACGTTCAWVADLGGGSGPNCPPRVPADNCEGREYCSCGDGCEPLIDLTTGCVCQCNDPFNCSGEECTCFCGGATYLGCSDAGRCAETEVTCPEGMSAALVDGCPACQ